MVKSIGIIGSLDTKGDQILYIKDFIEKRGQQATVIDVGVLGDAPFEPSIDKHEIARAAGTSLKEIISFGTEAKAMDKMAQGACHIVRELFDQGKIDGILVAGGSMVTSLAIRVMNVLPMGLPKIILSTIAYSPAINPDLLAGDIIFIPWLGGLWGMNELTGKVLEQASAMISSAAEIYQKGPLTKNKLIGVTSVGMASARYLYNLRPILEKKGYEAAVFHATGMSTRAFERAIAEGVVHAVLDLQVGRELYAQMLGSPFSPGPDRLETAGKLGIPQIVSPGTVNTVFWSLYKRMPRKFKNRLMFEHNPFITVVTTTTEEKIAMARLMAKKLNKATGPTSVIMATRITSGEVEKGVANREGNAAFIDELRNNLKPKIPLTELDCRYDDPEFANEVLRLLEEMI